MIAELCAEERCRILRERISTLNRAISMDIEERLEALHSARMALKRAEKDLARDQ